LGVDVNQQDAFGQTALHVAVNANSDECINALLSTKKLLLNKVNDKGETPLSLSISNSNVKIAKMLIEAGADPTLQNPSTGFNCLHVAMNSNNPSFDMIRFLTEFDSSMLFAKSNSGKNTVQLAIANGLAQNIIDYLSTFSDSNAELELDEICLNELCEIFDAKGNWKYWAMLMDIEEKIGEWEGQQSPSRALFSYLKVSLD
jgi:ankyrin repeat protein